MKVFVSHKKEDAVQSAAVATILRRHSHEVYLDIVDNNIERNGDDLARYLREQLGTCDALLAVVSSATKTSWWVPWEIGVATEKDYPLGTYLSDATTPPQYLKKWPVLRTREDVEIFAGLVSGLPSKVRRRALTKSLSESQAQREIIPEFHRELKQLIGQEP